MTPLATPAGGAKKLEKDKANANASAAGDCVVDDCSHSCSSIGDR
jgi:hypothetical protein